MTTMNPMTPIEPQEPVPTAVLTPDQPVGTPPPARSAESSPYVGPRAFRRGEKLYGRERETNTLADLVVAERLVLLYSPSGAGKSSLINAALLPALQAQDFHVLATIRVNLEPPTAVTGIAGLNRYVLSTLLSLEEGFPTDRRIPLLVLASLTIDEYLKRRCAEADEAGQDWSSLVLVFDQFEEILTVDPTDRESKLAFFNQLGLALRDRSRWALFAMREDYIAGLDPYLRPVPTRLASRFRLDLLETTGAIEAITEPVRSVGIEFDPDAAQQLVNDLRVVKVQQLDGSIQELPGQYVEPVQLQVVCSRLWQDLPGDKTAITQADVDAIGDIGQALAAYYDSTVTAVAQQTRVTERDIRKWFDTRLITLQGIRGQVSLGVGQTDGLDNQAVFAFEHAYLIRSDKRGGTTWFELAHDRLIQPVRESNARWFSQHLVPLQRQAEVWQDHGRPDGMLLTSQALDEAIAWAKDHGEEMNDVERAFLEHALKAREGRVRERRYNRRIRWLAIIASIIGVVAIIMGVFAAIQADEARKQATIALARELISASIDNLTIDPERSMLLAVVAVNKTGGLNQVQPSAIDALHRAFQANRLESTFTGAADRVYAVVYSPDGKWIAAASRDGSAFVWDVASGQKILQLKHPGNSAVSDVAYSPDGRWLATSAWDGAIRVWDATSGELRATLESGSRAWAVAYSPDGKRLASGHADGKARLWSLTDNTLLQTFDCASPVETVAFSPDGQRLGTGSDSGLAYVWEIGAGAQASGKPVFELKQHTDLINSIEFSPDGKLIATASADRTVRLWNAVTGESSGLIQGHLDWVYKATFSGDSGILATSSADRTVRLWNLSNNVETLRVSGHAQQVFDVVFSPDGQHLASASQDQTARVWNITPAGNRELFTNLAGEGIYSLTRTPDNQMLAVGLRNGGIEIWGLGAQAAGPRQTIDKAHGGVVEALAYSPDGRFLAGAGRDGVLTLWDVQAGYQKVWAQSKAEARFWALAYTADGQRLLTSDSQGVLTVWNAADGKLISTFAPPPAVSQPVMALALGVYPLKDRSAAAVGYDDGSIVIFDLSSGAPLAILPQQHYEAVQGVAFRPDGKLLASVSEDGLVNLYDLDLPAGKLILRNSLENHMGALYALAFSPNGGQLATGGADLSIRLWDPSTGDEKLILSGSSDRIYAILFGADGHTLITGSRDRTLRGYELDPVGLVRLAHARLKRDLTEQECLVYLHQKTCPK